MQPWITEPSFKIKKPLGDVFAPTGGWNDKIEPKAPWQQSPPLAPAYQSDEGLKKLIGIELAKAENPFQAACSIFKEDADTSKALWVSYHWLTDPIVIASRDIYLKNIELASPPLDKHQLAAKVLAFAETKTLTGKAALEPKDTIAAFKLYSEIMGYTGKVEIDNSIKNITNNEMRIKLVRAEDKPAKTIEHTPNSVKSEIVNENPSPITLKLVGGVSR